MSFAVSLAARSLAQLNRFFPKLARPQYSEVQAYQGWLEKSGEELYAHFYSNHARFEGRRVLDLACGYGGKLGAYARLGTDLICGVDINIPVLAEARRSSRLPPRVGLAAADVEGLPFGESVFDIVISDDGFDHFTHPSLVLAEIWRVLRPHGIALISFVPYYSRHCSHMGEYLRVPWHHVMLPREALRQAIELVAIREALPGSDPAAARAQAEGVFSVFQNQLSRLSLRGFQKALLSSEGWRLVRLRKQTTDFTRPLTYLPGMRELFTDSLHCALEKDAGCRIGALDFVRQTGRDITQDARAVLRRFLGIRSARAGSAKAPGQ